MFCALAFLTLLIEVAVGYPDALYRAIGHPVTWIGRLIGWFDRNLNRDNHPAERRKAMGVATLLMLLAAAIVPAWLLQRGFGLVPLGIVGTAIVASSLIAQRSLHTHVAAVAEALETGGVDAGRKAVSQIVGRDPERLDVGGVSRAAIESLAENFSDGVVAPAFWAALLGLPGLLAYKTINTADIFSVHANAHYTYVFNGREDIFCPLSIGEIIERLPPDIFSRVHRSYIVNIQRVTRLKRAGDNGVADLDSPVRRSVPVSRSRLPQLREQLTVYLQSKDN